MGGKKGDLSVSYGNTTVRIYLRGDGQVALSWREDGRTRRTTRASLDAAREFGMQTARAIDAASGKRWITPTQSDRLGMMERIAGGAAEVPGFLQAVEGAVKVLGSYELLCAAANYYVSHGPAGVKNIRLHAAADLILAEYDDSPPETRKTMKNALSEMKSSIPDVLLTSVTREMVAAHVHKPGLAKRTVRNRLSQASTFFNRCRELELWPHQRSIPTVSIKAPKLDDTAPGIFNPTEGKILLRKTLEENPQYLTYLVVAGWLMCRPSECLRLRWGAFDLDHGQLHLSAKVVGKTHRERWVPIPAVLIPWLREQRDDATSDRVCLTTARESLSITARDLGMEWPKDVLRHSAITYRLQVTGNIEQVAEEAGNSPTVIRKNYRRPIPPKWGELWFGLLEMLNH